MNPNLKNFYPQNTAIDVHAVAVDCQYIYYSCPYCLNIHQHGNYNKSLLNRIEERTSHCDLKIKPLNVNIHITNYTNRCCLYTDEYGKLKMANEVVLKRILNKQIEKHSWCRGEICKIARD